MNLNKILVISFLILMISTYQTDSGIIFTLLMKVLLLKGALFMTMPLSIGAFMMGQGMGFFAGNMMGGYMMLRAANRYHYTEKAKWTSPGYGDGGYTGGGGYSGGGQNGWGWQPQSGHTFHNAYDKGKDIGSALHALAEHKNKLASAFYKVKTLLGHGRPAPHYKGWGWSSGGSSGGGGYGTSHSSSYGSHSSHDDHDHHHGYHQYGSPSKYKPTTVTSTKYGSYNPYGHLKSSGGYRYKGHSSGIPKSQGNYASNYNSPVPGASYQNQESSYDTIVPVVDPSNTHYTSAYGGPGHEYTGILTNADLLNAYAESAQERTSSEADGLIYKDVTDKPLFSTASFLQPSSSSDSTISPNPILEKYLERRLQEEASKHKNTEQQLEAQQLIQMLRKAYLKQLVDSLKEEEKVDSSSTSTETYSSIRGSRSLEDFDKNNIIRRLLSYKISKQLSAGGSSEEKNSKFAERAYLHDRILDVPTSSTPTSTIENSSITETPTASTSFSSTENYPDLSFTTTRKAQITADNNYISSTEKVSESPENGISLKDFMELPELWIKAENTFSDEIQQPSVRVRRGAGVEVVNDQVTSSSIQNPKKTENNGNVQSIGDTQQQINSFVDDIKKFFTLLNVLDQDQCLQKLVCDVHTNQKDASTLTQYELNILTTFKLMKAVMPEGDEDSTTKYRRSALIGETGQSLELCQQSYSSCGYTSTQIISLGSETEASASASDWTDAASGSVGRSDYVSMPRVRRNLRSFYL